MPPLKPAPGSLAAIKAAKGSSAPAGLNLFALGIGGKAGAAAAAQQELFKSTAPAAKAAAKAQQLAKIESGNILRGAAFQFRDRTTGEVVSSGLGQGGIGTSIVGFLKDIGQGLKDNLVPIAAGAFGGQLGALTELLGGVGGGGGAASQQGLVFQLPPGFGQAGAVPYGTPPQLEPSLPTSLLGPNPLVPLAIGALVLVLVLRK